MSASTSMSASWSHGRPCVDGRTFRTMRERSLDLANDASPALSRATARCAYPPASNLFRQLVVALAGSAPAWSPLRRFG